jgi:hypothetical protein
MTKEKKKKKQAGIKQGTEYKVGPYHPPLETRFKKGQSGNPKGRRKGKMVSTILKELLEKKVTGIDPFDDNTKKKMTVSEAIAIKLITKVVNKDKLGRESKDFLECLKILLDRTEGKSVQILDIDQNVTVTEPEVTKDDVLEKLDELANQNKTTKKRSKK